jgi:hypothetical protein
MKTVAAALAAIAILCSAPVGAQQVRDAIEVMLSLAQAERKAIVAQNMGLTAEESEGFWPVYNAYEQKLKTLNEREAGLIADYAQAYQALTDEKAAELLQEAQAIDEERIKTRRDYAKKLRKVLAPKKVARAYQVESKIDAIIEFELARSIPLVQ